MEKKNKPIEEKVENEDKFIKKQLISSKLFNNKKDLLNAIIKDNEELSIAETNKRIENFMKGKVR